MIHAYSHIYLNNVMKNLGSVIDMAINSEEIHPNDFSAMFANSDVAKKIELAHPDMLAGKSATEMLTLVLGKDVATCSLSLDKSREYWAGWILARTQWELNRSFTEILEYCPLSRIIEMYNPYHEADESKAVDLIKSYMPKKQSSLKAIRNARGLTQEELANISGVNIRSIRSYEQGDNEIEKAQVDTLLNLSKALCCTIEELI